MVVQRLRSDLRSLEGIKKSSDLAMKHETVYAVDIINSTFDEEFSIAAFDSIASGRPVRRLCVRGRVIGSEVMGGAAKYFLQFC